jgi:hypothetical protein
LKAEQISRNKQKIIDKHIDITISGKKAKILNYKLGEMKDNYTGETKQVMEIITKITNKILEGKPVECLIKKDNEEVQFTGNWYSTHSHAGLYKYHYDVVSITITKTAESENDSETEAESDTTETDSEQNSD